MDDYSLLSQSDVQLMKIGLGTWPLSGRAYGATDDQTSLRVIQEAIARGVNFIDTADVYGNGHSEALIGKAVQGRREEICVATKVGWDFYHGLIRANYDPAYIRFALEESLRRLSTDYIDLYQLHNPPKHLINDHKIVALLEDLKKEGKIRYWGASIHDPEEGLRWIEQDMIQSLQVVLNLIDQRCLDRLLSEAHKRHIKLIVREPLACGLLSGKYSVGHQFSKRDHRRRWPKAKVEIDLKKIRIVEEVLSFEPVPLAQLAIEFCLHFDAVSVVIPGAKTPEQLVANLKPLNEKHLDDGSIRRIEECYLKDPLFKQGFYRN